MNYARQEDKKHNLQPFSSFILCLGILIPTVVMADSYQLGGGFRGSAKVEASAVSVDNYFYQKDNTVSAYGYRVRPEVAANRSGKNTSLALSTFVEHSNYDLRGNIDHYVDYGTSGNWSWRPWTRHTFELAGGFSRGHDSTGLQRTELSTGSFVGKLDEWNQISGKALYRYGAPDALGSNTLRAGQTLRRYATNRGDTVFLDFSVRELEYELAYEYSPRTAFLFNLEQRAIDYSRPITSSGRSRNGNEFTIGSGVRWVASGKTSGSVQLGIRNFSIDGRQSPTRQSLAWKLSVNWDPSRATRFNLAGGRTTTETFRRDTFYIDQRKINLSWQQTWSNRFSSNAGSSYTQSEFIGSTRKDEFINGYVSADYLLARQLNIFGQYSSRTRNSSSSALDYDAPEFTLGLRWTL